MYARIDAREDGRVYGVYSGFSQPAADVTFLDPINAEHTVPQSWFGSAEPMRSDIHHLFPTHKDVNAARSSKPFGEVTDSQTDRWYATDRGGRAAGRDAHSDASRRSASPRTIATSSNRPRRRRATRRGRSSTSTRCIRAGVEPSSEIAADGLPVLLAWHEADPPDARERQRNERIEAEQGNRNPYVDHPEIACRAWELPC